MSNSIWKTPDQKPERTGDIVYVLEDGDFGNFFYIEGNDFPTVVMANQFCFVTEDTPIKMVKWTYLADLIIQADKAERLEKQLDSLKKYSDSLRHRVEKILKKNKTLKNTVSGYFMKSVELGIELENTQKTNVRLQKAVDLALVGLANSQTYATLSGNHGLSDVLHDKYIKEIVQLIKEE